MMFHYGLFLAVVLTFGSVGAEQGPEANAQVCLERMKPSYEHSRYYANELDKTYQHITFMKALTFLRNKLVVSPSKRLFSWMFYPKQTQETFDITALLDPQQTVPCAESQQPLITWIGHATFLIQMAGLNILTDPIFGNVKLGPLTIGKRDVPPGVRLEDLPRIDAIVISHNHADHTDTDSLKALAKKYDPVVYVPEGNKALIASMGFSRVIEATWWDALMLNKQGKTMRLTCVPALHWSIRFSLQSYRKALWSGWVLQAADTTIYFAGDTAYADHFKQIGNEFPAIDIALLPIGPTHEHDNKHQDCNPFDKYCHVDAGEAVDACIDLHARCFVPMHYGTFGLAKHTLTYPLDGLSRAWAEKSAQLADVKLLIARCGKTYSVEHTS